MRFFKNLSVSLLLITSVAACGGDDGPSVRNGDKKVSQLSAAERTDLCQDAEALLDDVDEAAFTRLSCAIFASFSGECTDAAIDDCVEMAAGGEQTEETTCNIDDEGFDAAGCDVTVEELFGCMDATLHAMEEAGKNASCTNLDLNIKVDECKNVEARCPQALTDDSGAE